MNLVAGRVMRLLRRVGSAVMMLLIASLLVAPFLIADYKALATKSDPAPTPCNNDSYKKSISVSKSTISIDQAINAMVKNQARLRFTLADNSGAIVCAVDFTSDRTGIPATEFNPSETFGGDVGPFYSFHITAVSGSISEVPSETSFKAVAVISADPSNPKDAGRFQGIFLTPSDDRLTGSGGKRFWLWSAVKSNVTASGNLVAKLNRLDELTGRRVVNFVAPQETTNPVTITGNIDIDFSGSEVETAGVADKVGPLKGRRDLLPPLRDDPALSICLFYQNPTFKGSYSLTDCIKVPTSTGQATDGRFSLSKKLITGNYIAAAAINVETSGMVQLIGDYGTWSFSLAHPIDLRGYGKDLNNVNASLIDDNQFTIYMGITGSGRNALFFGQESFEVKKDTTAATLNPVLKLTNESPDAGSINPSQWPCGLKTIVDLFSQGIGGAIQKMIGCLIKDVIGGSTEYTDKYMCAAGQISINSAILPAYAQEGGNKVEIAPTPKDKVGLPKCDPVTPGATTSTDPGGGGQGTLGSFEWELKNPGGIISRVWHISMGVVNVVVILALLAIAFANILHLNINTYAAKKALPGLIIGVIGANASLLFARFLADVTQALSTWAADIGTHGGTISSLVGWDFPLAIGRALIDPILLVVAGGFLFWPIWLIGIILVLYYLFMIIAFMFSLFKRLIILYFLVMVAPIAFIAYGVPGLQQYFFKWWDSFLRFLFLFPIILFGMALTVMLADTIGTNNLMDIFTVPGMVGIALVLSAGSMVLKLPKTLTKVLDPAGGFKKLLGAAPGIMGAGQWAHGKMGAAGVATAEQRYDAAVAARKKGAPIPRADENNLRRQMVIARGRHATGQKRWGTARGAANIFGRPEETAKAWWQKRQEAGKSNDMLESSKLTVGRYNIADTVMGADAAYKEQATRIQKEMNEQNINSPDQIKKFASDSPLNTKKILEEVRKYRKTLDPAKQMELMTDFGQAITAEKFDKILTKNPALAAQLQGAKIESMVAVEKAGVSKIIARQLSRSGHPGTQQDLARRLLDFDRMDAYGVATSQTTGEDGGDGSSGGGAQITPYNPERGKTAVAAATYIRTGLDNKVKDSIRAISEDYRQALEQSSQPDLDGGEVTALRQKLGDLKKRAFTALSDSFINSGEEILEGFNQHSHEQVNQMLENVRTAMDLNIDSGSTDTDAQERLNAELARRHSVSQAATSAKDEITAKIDKGDLAEILQQQGEMNTLVTQQLQAIAVVAGKPFDPKMADTITRAISTELGKFGQMISGPDRKSLRTTVNNAIDRAVSEMGEQQITTSSVVSAIRATQNEPAPTVTNYNTEQSTTVVPVSATPVSPQSPANPLIEGHPSSSQTPSPGESSTPTEK